MTEQWLCIHLHRLSLDVVVRGLESSEAVAVCASRGSSRWIHDRADGLARQGIKPQMALASAYALAPGMRVYPRQLMAEASALEQVAGWCYGISSRVSLFPPDMVLAEVGASLSLLGPLERIAQAVRQGLKRLGYRSRLAAAPSAAAARLMARAGRYGRITRLQPLPRVLSTAPIAAAEIPARDLESLSRMGLTTLQELLDLPRPGLQRRFDQQLLDYLDQVLGLQPEPLRIYQPDQAFHSTLELPCEVENQEALLFPIQRLLTELCDFLVARDLIMDRFHIVLGHSHSEHSVIPMGLLEPGRNEQRILELVRERLHHFQLAAPVRELSLKAQHFFPCQARCQDLFETRSRGMDQLPRLVERLCSRLGDTSVFTLSEIEDHRPEKAWQPDILKQRQASGQSSSKSGSPMASRPLWILDQPTTLPSCPTLVSGPERIESGWWDGEDVCRDYYVAECRPGEHLWVYRDRREDRWYLQGIFS
ncbi:MAG: DNA polymerase Y family protein [Xanthomonadales bacterium]|nr:DNA polymerase Y family protein [Xanthomonadales bacterium]